MGPWSTAGYRRPGDDSPHGPGAVLWLRSERRSYLRHVTSVEKILEVEEGRRLVYTVVGGIPVRNYRAEITLVPVDGGTHVRWAADWDNTTPGRLAWRSLRVFTPRSSRASWPPPTRRLPDGHLAATAGCSGLLAASVPATWASTSSRRVVAGGSGGSP